MLNGLSTMYTIDSEILGMDEDALAGDWGALARTTGGILRLLTNFDSIQAKMDNDVYLQDDDFLYSYPSEEIYYTDTGDELQEPEAPLI